MSIYTDPAAKIDQLINRNDKAPHANGSVEPVGETLAEAKAVAEALAQAEHGASAISAALANPETIGSLVLVATRDSAAYEALLMALRTKARVRDVQGLERAVRDARRQQEKTRKVTRIDNGAVLARVRAALDDAPVPEDAVVPLGWRLGPFAVAREHTTTDEGGGTKSTLEVIAPAPVVIAGRLANVNDGTEAHRIAWRRDGRWRQETVDRGVVANARKLVEVSGQGLPVTSGTAGDLVRYLAAFEAANIADLPRVRVSHQLGLQGDRGDRGFLWGKTFVAPDGNAAIEIDLDTVHPTDWRDDWLAFRGASDGDNQLAEGYRSAGTFEEWREAVALVADHPAVMVALYASLAAPLLEILDAQNFVCDWSHQTSTGKTTTLRLAASVWGAPDERASASAIQTWDMTRTWFTDTAANLHGIPLILDDTKRARKPDVVTQTIYDLVSGRGRGRSSPVGTRRMQTWRTILLSSGEQRITGFSQDGGTRPRVLEFWGAPFGTTDKATGSLVQRLNLVLMQHFGHAGLRFVRFLLQHRADWPAWREQFRKNQSHNLDRAQDNPFAGRIAEPVAVLTLSEALACAALELPWGFRGIASSLWDDLAGEASEADRAAAALDYAMSWAFGHPDLFFPRSGRQMPTGGWAGYWDEDPWRFVGFLPDRLTAVLQTGGFDDESTKRIWFDRGWLHTDEGRRTCQVRIKDDRVRTVAVTRTAIEGVQDGP